MSELDDGGGWEKAKNLLLGAVDAVIQMKDRSEPTPKRQCPSSTSTALQTASTSGLSTSRKAIKKT